MLPTRAFDGDIFADVKDIRPPGEVPVWKWDAESNPWLVRSRAYMKGSALLQVRPFNGL